MKTMVCNKCNNENILDANYCIYCGNKYSRKEKYRARRYTFVGLLETMDNIGNIKCIAIITKNKIVRVLAIIAVLLIGLVNIIINGYNMKLTKNNNYSIMHYKDMYYIIIDKDKTMVDLYIPNRIDYLQVELMENNVKTNKQKIEKNESIELSSNDENSYYVINGIGKKNKDSLKVKVIYESK
jgi:hypothetical protein